MRKMAKVLFSGVTIATMAGAGLITESADDNTVVLDQTNAIVRTVEPTKTVKVASFEDVKAPNVTVSSISTKKVEEVETPAVSEDESVVEESGETSTVAQTEEGSLPSTGGSAPVVQSAPAETAQQTQQSPATSSTTGTGQTASQPVQQSQPAQSAPAAQQSQPVQQAQPAQPAVNNSANEQAAQKAAAQKAAEDAAKKAAADKAAAEQAAQKAAADKAAAEAAKKAAEEAARPKFAPNSVFVNGQKVQGNVNGRVVTNVSPSVFSAGNVVVSDANGNGTTVSVGGSYEIDSENRRYDNNQDVTVLLNGNSSYVFIQQINSYARRVAQGF